MPSPIAHALGGVAVAWVADLLPAHPSGRDVPGQLPATRSRIVLTCACLAALPDVDLLLPMSHRTVTHSFVAVAVVGVLMIIAAGVTGKVTTKIALTYMAAYASHLLLDWLQTDPTPPFGLQLLWPFSSTWFISGWTVFRGTERRHFFELATMQRNAVAVLQELAILAPLMAALWLVRVKALARFAAEMSRGHHSS
jgi:membrane-bound metal-dependent hydrolase YbcI (DUF457 family)